MKSKGLLVLTALIGTGLVLGSCGGTTNGSSEGESGTTSSETVTSSESSDTPATSTSGENTSSESQESAYTATRVTINSKTPDRVVVGETIDFDQYITVSSPENGTFGLRVRDGSTGAAVIDGHKVTITMPGSIGIQVVGANDANLRLWTVTAVSADTQGIVDYLTSLSYNYSVQWTDSTGTSLIAMTYHNENYWLALSDIQNSSDGTSSTWSYWGAIQAGEHRYEIDFYEDYTYSTSGTTVSYRYNAHPGIFDDSLYYAAGEMAFNPDTVTTDPMTGMAAITDSGISGLLQTGAGSNYEALKTAILDKLGYKSAFLLPMTNEGEEQLLGVQIVFVDANMQAVSYCSIFAAGETNFDVLDKFVEAGVAPSYLTNEDIANYLGAKVAEKASTTIEASVSYGAYLTNTQTNVTSWYDAGAAAVGEIDSLLYIPSYAPAGTYTAQVDGDSYFSTATLSELYYTNTDPSYLAIGKDTDGHYYRVSGADPAAWEAKEDLGTSFDLWNANGRSQALDEKGELIGTEYFTPAALTTEYLSGLPYTSVTTEGDVITAAVDPIEDEGKLVGIIAGLVPNIGILIDGGVLQGITTNSGDPCYTMFDDPTIAYNTKTGDVTLEAIFPNLAEDSTLGGNYVGLRISVTLTDFGKTEVPAFGFAMAETTEGGTTGDTSSSQPQA